MAMTRCCSSKACRRAKHAIRRAHPDQSLDLPQTVRAGRPLPRRHRGRTLARISTAGFRWPLTKIPRIPPGPDRGPDGVRHPYTDDDKSGDTLATRITEAGHESGRAGHRRTTAPPSRIGFAVGRMTPISKCHFDRRHRRDRPGHHPRSALRCVRKAHRRVWRIVSLDQLSEDRYLDGAVPCRCRGCSMAPISSCCRDHPVPAGTAGTTS